MTALSEDEGLDFKRAEAMLDEIRETILARREPTKAEVHYVVAMLITDLLDGEPRPEWIAFLDELKVGTLETLDSVSCDDAIGVPIGEA